MQAIVVHALSWGAIFSAVVGVMLVVLLRVNPELMLNDYPPDVRAAHGPMSARTRRQRGPVSLLFVLVAGFLIRLSVDPLPSAVPGQPRFGEVFVHALVMLMVFNLVDLLLIDWPLVWLQPRWAVLPGTEGLAGYRDYRFHLRAFARGSIGILVVSAIIALVVVAF